MKQVHEYGNTDTPEIGEVFTFRGERLVAVPAEFMGGCRGCIAQANKHKVAGVCRALPSCHGVSFIQASEYDCDEFKVRLVKWRMGLKDDE